jgi:hypothetical protein
MFATTLAPVVQTFDSTMPIPMTEVVGSVTYIGYCKRLGIGFDKPEWLILRITEAGGLTTPEYSEGTTKFESKWSDRATIQYSR